MPLFKCEGCGCIENTAAGDYWCADKKLCSECSSGKWHGYFPKQTPEQWGYVLLEDGFHGPRGGWNMGNDARKAMDRLAEACRVVLRQWEGGHAPGNDAILDLHRALKGTVPELRRHAIDTAEALRDLEIKKFSNPSTIECKYSCSECGVKRASVNVPARPKEMDVARWVKEVAAYMIYADHCCRSPLCKANTMDELMIPITGAEHIGGQNIT